MRSTVFPKTIKDLHLWVLFVLALLLRLGLVGYHAQLGWQLQHDPSMYLALADSLGNGAYSMFYPLDIPDTIKMPGYPALIHLLGGRIGLLLLLQALLSASKVPLVFLLARSVGLRAPLAFAAATLMAFEPVDILLAGQVLTDSLFGTLVLAAALLLFRNAGWGATLLSALLLASAAWLRPNGLWLVLVLGLGSYFFLHRSMFKSAAFTALGMALLLPWAWRNQQSLGRFYMGDSAAVAAAYYQVPDVLREAKDPRASSYKKMLQHKAASMDWEDRSSFHAFFDGLRSATQETLLTYPLTWLRVHGTKAAHIYVAPARGHIRLFFADQPWIKNLLVFYSSAFSLLLVLTALVCFLHLRQVPHWLWLLLLCAAYLIFSGALTTTDARFKSPAMPLLLVASAWALQHALDRYRSIAWIRERAKASNYVG